MDPQEIQLVEAGILGVEFILLFNFFLELFESCVLEGLYLVVEELDSEVQSSEDALHVIEKIGL